MFTFEFDHFDWLWQFYSEWRNLQNYSIFKFSAKVQVCYLLGQHLIMTKLLNSVPFIKKTLVNHLVHLNLIILTDFQSFTVYEDKLQNSSIFKISANVRVCDIAQNLKMTKTSELCSIHQENTCKSTLHGNLIILTDFHSFTVNEEKLQNYSIFKFCSEVQVYDLGQNLIMTKTS